MNLQSLLSITEFTTKNKITFVNPIPERLKCVICKEVLKNAKQTSCGCKACEKCIKDYLEGKEKSCPSKECTEVKLRFDRDVLQDNATNKEIGNLVIKCIYTSCSVTDTMKNVISHSATCEYRELSCERCHKMYCYKDKVRHNQQDCDQRIVKCPHCLQEMVAITLQTIHLNLDHDGLCSKYVGDCPNECGEKCLQIKEHLSKGTQQRIELVSYYL